MGDGDGNSKNRIPFREIYEKFPQTEETNESLKKNGNVFEKEVLKSFPKISPPPASYQEWIGSMGFFLILVLITSITLIMVLDFSLRQPSPQEINSLYSASAEANISLDQKVDLLIKMRQDHSQRVKEVYADTMNILLPILTLLAGYIFTKVGMKLGSKEKDDE